MGTAVAERNVGITGLLDSPQARKIIEPMLWPGTDYRRVIQEVYLVVRDKPELLECEKSSIVRAVGRAVSWGLVIGETVHLVPFDVKVTTPGQPDRWEKRCKALQDYKGKIELIVRAGAARAIDAEDVYEGDDFLMELGINPVVRLRPELNPDKRGAYLGTYAIARLPHNLVKIIWVPAKEVEAIRAKSKGWKNKPREYWYGPKTAIHRLSKELPKSERMAKVFQAFREDEEEDATEGEIDNGAILTVGAPPVIHDGPKPVVSSDDAYGTSAPKALTEGAAQPIKVAAAPVTEAAVLEAHRAQRAAAAEAGRPIEHDDEPDFSDVPFPEDLAP